MRSTLHMGLARAVLLLPGHTYSSRGLESAYGAQLSGYSGTPAAFHRLVSQVGSDIPGLDALSPDVVWRSLNHLGGPNAKTRRLPGTSGHAIHAFFRYVSPGSRKRP